jgi:HAD superfamily hydrolase (TIGR01459 family)
MKLPTTPFHEIIPQYDTFFVDIYGVVHDGKTLYPGVVDTLNQLIATKKVIFLSNAPRTSEMTLVALREYGINATLDGIITSGDLVRTELKRDLSKKIYHIGDDKNQDMLRDINVTVVTDVLDADLILLSVFVNISEREDKFDDILQEAAKLNLLLICTNPDTYVPNGYCAGVFAARYEKMGGRVDYYGKPYGQIFEIALDRCGIQKDKILMIGDTFETDVLGAKRFGIDVAMTLTGNGTMAHEDLSLLKFPHDISPTWVIDGLWQ